MEYQIGRKTAKEIIFKLVADARDFDTADKLGSELLDQLEKLYDACDKLTDESE